MPRKKPSVKADLLKSKDLRPFWAHRGPAAHEWDTLNRDERQAVAAAILADTTSSAADLLSLTVDDYIRLYDSALEKLGFDSGGEFSDHHARMVFESTP